uniref:Uncharacterized protein n=1 Tax=Mycena chlorophos TaxID=658473 RepID=A0ABQ0L455_MYCCL|nr:predicted protein [Mycena chlorophos]
MQLTNKARPWLLLRVPRTASIPIFSETAAAGVATERPPAPPRNPSPTPKSSSLCSLSSSITKRQFLSSISGRLLE